ncbi:uncharacterized protein CANTADRAFT_26749 [Suhomyces tanzawaensis NRRL Y-17324]|uniref:Uncharacterized protein n=1 Tax=Suhomyces tanzawaensis NRRL Y-17324 TaxID=984487 RepID=A0A1E4SH27_9ASCO|nr:uncharacterized protein CANTADRAFT_26749 [Suhomyces tanzawaensis NRRL Y-17324]ODV78819.1 hypothetical protein CANTADRAFT_26749 [Suhomyces tanzawaensis NRRL Y-17324]
MPVLRHCCSSPCVLRPTIGLTGAMPSNASANAAFHLSYCHTRLVSYYSRAPLNYETLLNRINTRPPASISPHTLLVDCIRASRTLQRKPKTHASSTSVLTSEMLGLKTAGGAQIEHTLWKFLTSPANRLLFTSSDSLIKEYVTCRPQPSNFQHLVGLCETSMGQASSRNDTSVFHTVLGTLLDQKNYYNLFVLVDRTVGSKRFQEVRRNQLVTSLAALVLTTTGLSAIEACLLPLFPFWAWALVNYGLWGTVYYGLLRSNLTTHLSRIRWRSYNSLWYKFVHQEELVAVNRIITHYEEHNEVNVRNFHHSEVRKESNMNMFDHNEYILEMPSLDDGKDPEMDQLQVYFKVQLHKKKMVLNELDEELRFLEFWLTHGENFAWVEPDQDPGEIVKLKIANRRIEPASRRIGRSN